MSRQHANLDVLELNFHRAAGVDLYCDQPIEHPKPGVGGPERRGLSRAGGETPSAFCCAAAYAAVWAKTAAD